MVATLSSYYFVHARAAVEKFEASFQFTLPPTMTPLYKEAKEILAEAEADYIIRERSLAEPWRDTVPAESASRGLSDSDDEAVDETSIPALPF